MGDDDIAPLRTNNAIKNDIYDYGAGNHINTDTFIEKDFVDHKWKDEDDDIAPLRTDNVININDIRKNSDSESEEMSYSESRSYNDEDDEEYIKNKIKYKMSS